MICPECFSVTHVIDSRPYQETDIRRRRMCGECEHRFTTFELTRDRIDRLVAIEKEATRLQGVIKKVHLKIEELIQ